VVEVQAQRESEIEVDGKPVAFTIRADYLVVDSSGNLFVAEVKTGNKVPNPVHPATRRQLLEYRVGFTEAIGVLLVDMEKESVRRVRFPLLGKAGSKRRGCLGWLV
jgi:hypothetical protein